MVTGKEALSAAVLAAFDAANFNEKLAIDEDGWSSILNSGHVGVFTARDEKNELVAVLVLKTSSVPTGRWYFYTVGVAEKYRKMNLASRLFHEAVRSEQVAGIINSHTHIDNIASIQLHKSLGFRPIQYVTDFYDDFEDAILWEIRA